MFSKEHSSRSVSRSSTTTSSAASCLGTGSAQLSVSSRVTSDGWMDMRKLVPPSCMCDDASATRKLDPAGSLTSMSSLPRAGTSSAYRASGSTVRFNAAIVLYPRHARGVQAMPTMISRTPLHALLLCTATLCLASASACGDDDAGDPTGTGAASSGAAGSGASASGAASSGGGGGGTAGSGAGPACPTDTAPEAGMAITAQGATRATAAGTTWAWKGIPFAAPPVGDLRWKAPAAPGCFDGVLEANAFGPACPQFEGNGEGAILGDEDCLTLNVWAPQRPAEATPPVMVWIHGGGHVAGSASEAIVGTELYDAQRLVERTGAIVVTIQYRLGPLGWLAHPALGAESEVGTTGMYGHLDQVAALRWVHDNIAAFGGDPARVTIFGESAGGVSVCALLASPLAAGLFSGAIMQSGGCVAHPREDAEALGAEVFGDAGCGDDADPLACMRALSTADVLSAHPIVIDVAGAVSGYSPVIEGHAMLDRPLDVIASGMHNAVPFLVGALSDETSRSVPLPQTATVAQYQAAVTALFGALAVPVLAQYPAADYPSPWAAYVALTSDAKFICSARRAARAALEGQREPVRLYHLSRGIDGSPALAPFGAWHGLDVLYLFDHLDLAGYTPTPSESAVSAAMIDRWSSFAASGDPDANGASPAWPLYDLDDAYLGFDDPVIAGTGIRAPQCDFWDSLGL